MSSSSSRRPACSASSGTALSKPTAKVVVKELDKDLTKVPDHELASHFSPSS